MNISSILKPAQNFIKNNLESSDDFGTVESNRTEAQRVDGEVERIHQDAVDIRGELSELKENSKLAAPTFANVSNKQVLMGTVSAGATLGGAAGVLTNVLSGGGGQASFDTQTVPIYEQKMNGLGFDSKYYTYGGTPEDPRGWEVNIIHKEPTSVKVGEYETKTPTSSGISNIAVSGLIGAGAGALGGAVVGGAIVGLRKVMGKEYNGALPRETEGDNKLLITSGIAGAVIGAGAGALSAMTNSTTIQYETQSIPAMDTKVLGTVPSGTEFFVPNNGEYQPPTNPQQVVELMDQNLDKLARNGYQGTEALEPREVTGQVPQRGGLLGGGDVKIDTEKKEFNVGPSLLGSVLGGAAVGAVTGVAGGVLVNVLRKSL